MAGRAAAVTESAKNEGAVAGLALPITVYGVIVMIADLLFHKELVPHSEGQALLLLAALVVVGGVIGFFVPTLRARRRRR